MLHLSEPTNSPFSPFFVVFFLFVSKRRRLWTDAWRFRPQIAPSLSSLSPADPSQSAASARQPAPGARRMVAIFDYDPRESSPNTDVEVRPALQSDRAELLQQRPPVLILCLSAAGGADLQRRGRHSRVWRHGRRRLLLRECVEAQRGQEQPRKHAERCQDSFESLP